MTVGPSAKAAAMERMGYSSIIEAARSAGTSTPAQSRESGGDIAHPLAAFLALVRDGEIRAHLQQGVEEARPQGVEEQALNGHLRAGGDQGGH